jgi:hypothetical protein
VWTADVDAIGICDPSQRAARNAGNLEFYAVLVTQLVAFRFQQVDESLGYVAETGDA